MNRAAIAKGALGLVLTAVGLWFAFLHSKYYERAADGSIQSHFDHTALYIGVGVALFGMLLVSPDTVAQAIRDARSIIGQRLSGQQPTHKDGE